ncbi:MAG TPA: hypothetical protein VKU61_04545 [Candidatus Binatia bacterium]|nr:hypothetical protein [Candidatus Binatia bacterium]
MPDAITVPRSATAVRGGAIADVVGHCVVVFAFVPTLAVLPGWLHAEATNPLNWHEPIVLAFLPVRGMVALWSGFDAGLVPGILGGLIDGILLGTWLLRAQPRRAFVAGGICGTLAGCGVVLASVALGTFQRGFSLPRAVPVAFELASGVVCGMLAVPTAVRLASAPR